ncbi:glycosyltransferase family 4 protein [Candidatus Uhrbacteria bacterium]|nr:glycosyltransferase family 4 protein [Candidatus Uhrbacteria bacterium]
MPILGIDASRAVKKEKTGVEWYSWHLLQAMQKLAPPDWRVRLYVPEEIGNWKLEIRNWQWRVLKWIGRGWTQGRLSLEMMKSPPDILFVPSHTIPLVHPERTVTTVHDVVFARHPELYDPKDLKAQKRGLDFALKFARKIIVPSKATREEVVRAGAREEQVVVVPHGVGVGDWGLVNSLIQNESSNQPINQSTNQRYILFIGRIEKKKNVLGLVQAFRRLMHNAPQPPLTLRGGDELKLVLAGSLGYGAEDVLQAIKTFKLEDRVIHLGYVERAQYQTLLKNAALLASPSFGEGFGFPVLEAMAAGVPVVCADLPVLHEVGGNAAQYVNPRDPEDIARGIEGVLQNEMLQSEMIKRGKEIAAEFTWEKTARETWNVLCNIAGR